MSPRRSRAALTASPVLVGAVTVLVTIVAVFLSYNANTGLPFVPDLRPEGQPPERLAARGGLRRAHRRRARGPGLEDRADAARRRHHLRPGHAQARQGDRAAAGRLHPARATALVARPQVPPGGARHRPGRLQGRRHGADPPGAAARSWRSTTSSTCSTTRPASDRATRSTATAPASPAAAATSTRRSTSCSRCSTTSSRWRKNLAEPEDAASTASSGRSPTRRPRSRRWPRSRPRCS